MHRLGSVNDVVAFPLQRHDLKRRTGMEFDAQYAAEQDRNRRGVSLSPRLMPLFAVEVCSPFQFDCFLVPLAQFGWNELANEPACPTYLI